jgi:elongation factor P
VLKYEHLKLGRGPANIKLKVKNLKSKAILEKTFISGAKVEEAEVEKRALQFLFLKGKMAVFMDPKSFEQFEVGGEILEGKERFLKEGEEVEILFFEGRPVSLELPLFLVLEVKETGPGVKGDSATNIWKTAVLENKLQVKVPLFVKVGDRVKIDTRSGEYVERVR